MKIIVGAVIDHDAVARLPDGAVVRREPDYYGGPYAEMTLRGGLIARRASGRFRGVGSAPNGWRVVALPDKR